MKKVGSHVLPAILFPKVLRNGVNMKPQSVRGSPPLQQLAPEGGPVLRSSLLRRMETTRYSSTATETQYNLIGPAREQVDGCKEVTPHAVS